MGFAAAVAVLLLAGWPVVWLKGEALDFDRERRAVAALATRARP
jgi:hypothetical protein